MFAGFRQRRHQVKVNQKIKLNIRSREGAIKRI